MSKVSRNDLPRRNKRRSDNVSTTFKLFCIIYLLQIKLNPFVFKFIHMANSPAKVPTPTPSSAGTIVPESSGEGVGSFVNVLKSYGPALLTAVACGAGLVYMAKRMSDLEQKVGSQRRNQVRYLSETDVRLIVQQMAKDGFININPVNSSTQSQLPFQPTVQHAVQNHPSQVQPHIGGSLQAPNVVHQQSFPAAHLQQQHQAHLGQHQQHAYHHPNTQGHASQHQGQQSMSPEEYAHRRALYLQQQQIMQQQQYLQQHAHNHQRSPQWHAGLGNSTPETATSVSYSVPTTQEEKVDENEGTPWTPSSSQAQ